MPEAARVRRLNTAHCFPLRLPNNLFLTTPLLAILLLVTLYAATGAVSAAPVSEGYFTAEQARDGRSLYVQHCASCHGDKLEGGVAPAMTGAAFAQRWSSATRSVDDLFYIMRTSMPRPAVGSLSENEYVALLAYTLSSNGVAAGNRALRADSAALGAIRMAAGKDNATPAKIKRGFFSGEGGMRPAGKGPSAAELANAAASSDWLYHTGNYQGTRFTPLDQINRNNVDELRVACLYQLGGNETFITGPIVHRGVMYLTTAHVTAAIDASTCRERWRHTWIPEDEELWGNNRGVAIQDGYVVRGTADGYLFALDAADGGLLWARQVAYPAAGETITMPPMIFEDRVLIGPAGSENNVQGWIGAFALADGQPMWRFNTIPRVGEPGAETWANREILPMGGGAVWTPLSLDVARAEVYVAVTNPAPDFAAHLRPGANLYTNSLVALDVRKGTLNWYSQLVPNDDKDWDLTQVSPLYEAMIKGDKRKLVVTAGKDGVLRVLNRESGERIFETPLGVRVNDDKPITAEGTRYCPGVLGGVQWNGPSFYPAGNLLFVTMVNWCTTAKLDEEVRHIPGELYLGASLEMDDESSGSLTAIDASSGEIKWQYDSDEPMVAATLTTGSGLVIAGELKGDMLAFDAETGKVLYRFNTGGSMAGGLVSYAVDGQQHIAAVSGKGSFWFGGKGAATVVVFRL